MRLKANIGAIDIVVHGLIWLLLSVVTFGIAAFFLPYSFCKFIINRTELVDEYGQTRQLQCDLNVLDQFGHALLWLVFSVLTLGIAYFFYLYKVWNYALNNTQVVDTNASREFALND